MNAIPECDDRDWYNQFYGERSRPELVVRREIVDRYLRLSHPELFHLEKWFRLIGDVKHKKVLYIACGLDTSGILLALRGAEVWALDIAFDAVRQQQDM